MDFIVIIPARYASSRLEAKLIQDISGKPLIQHTYENAKKSAAEQVIIATDDKRIKNIAQSFGARVCMTSKNHTSGTTRIAEVLEMLKIKDDKIVVNVQADEPMLPASVINQVANNLANSNMQMATLCEKIIDREQYLDPNCVKVVFDKSGKVLYFSRAPIPFFRDNDFDKNLCFKHIGIYAYTASFVKKYLTLKTSDYEKAEKLEQLTILNEGFSAHISPACKPTGYGVDTLDDLEKIRQVLK